MMRSRFPTLAISLVIICVLSFGCSNFRPLTHDLSFTNEKVIVTANITNASSHGNIKGITLDWDRNTHILSSAEISQVKGLGLVGYYVDRTNNQYFCAYSDKNWDNSYQPGEPAWIYSNADGTPKRLDLTTGEGRRLEGELSSHTMLPRTLVEAAYKFVNEQADQDVNPGWDIPMALGEVAEVSESRFSTETGAKEYRDPAGYKTNSDIGIYFLEEYDPNRIPVLFVHGAAGDPEDWSLFFETLDSDKYQFWFYVYPFTDRLAKTGGALNRGIQILHSHYGFDELNIVAHSMGGLIARYAIINNHKQGKRYIKHFVTISSPFGGMKFAEAGADVAGELVPSWYDMTPDSSFQQYLFDTSLRGKVPHMLLYGNKSKDSLILPPKNDGIVSVPSMTREQAVRDAVIVQSFDESHVSILTNRRVIRLVESFIGE